MKKILFILFIFILNINKAQNLYSIEIKDVNVIDVVKGKIIAHQNVYIQDQLIAKVVPANKKYPAKESIDGSGKFLSPGFWDMHTHNWWNIHFSEDYIQNGVLGVRNMYTPMAFVNPLKDSIQKGLLNGPYYYAAGRVLEGSKPEFPDWLVIDSTHKISAALDTLQKEKSDFIKVYNKIPKVVYVELMKQAKARGMRVEGHLPMEVSATEASQLGQRSFEHLLGVPDLCSHDNLFKEKHNNNWFAAIMKEDGYANMTIDEKLAKKQFSILAKNNTYVCPTLVVLYNYFHPDTLFETNPLLQKYPTDMQNFWKGEVEKYRKKDAAYKLTAAKKYENLKKIVYLLYKYKVPMLTGTDVINPYCYPGYSLHQEFQLLSECGIPNDEIIKMATINAAQFIGLNQYGSIKTGNIASLVLLNGKVIEVK